MRATVLALLAVCAGCAEEPRRTPGGIAPTGSSAVHEPARPPAVALEAPAPDRPAARPEPAVAFGPADFAGVALSDLGPLRVMSWPEAERQALARIAATNADEELATLRAELEGPR